MSGRDAALAAWAEERRYRKDRAAQMLAREADAALAWWRTHFGPLPEPPPPPDPAVADSVMRPGVLAVHLGDPDGFVVEFVPRNGYAGPVDVYLLIVCPRCDKLVPSAHPSALASLADLGQSLDAGPAFHEAPGPVAVGGQAVATVCPGGAPHDDDAAQPSAGDMLLTILTGLVRDVVADMQQPT